MDTTDAIEAHAGGNTKAASEILPLVYQELRGLARAFMHRERSDHTLQPTALVHEAYVRLVDRDRISWQGRTHFFAIAADEMRRVLIEHARGHGAKKRGGELQRVTFTEGLFVPGEAMLDVLQLDQALSKLHALDQRQARIAELRFFAGMNVRETASILGVSERTVKGEWRVAKAWLRREIGHSGDANHGSRTP